MFPLVLSTLHLSAFEVLHFRFSLRISFRERKRVGTFIQVIFTFLWSFKDESSISIYTYCMIDEQKHHKCFMKQRTIRITSCVVLVTDMIIKSQIRYRTMLKLHVSWERSTQTNLFFLPAPRLHSFKHDWSISLNFSMNTCSKM